MGLLEQLTETLPTDIGDGEYQCPSCGSVFETAHERCPDCGETDIRERGVSSSDPNSGGDSGCDYDAVFCFESVRRP